MTIGIVFEPLHTIVPLCSNTQNLLGFVKITLNSYSDSISSQVSTDKVFGRTDPIYTFEGNTRKISLNFIATTSIGINPELTLKKLSSLLYPTYEVRDGLSPVLVSPPLIRFAIGELDENAPGFVSTPLVDEIGYLDGFNFTLSELAKSQGGLTTQTVVTLPQGGGEAVQTRVVASDSKYYTVDLNFNVIHREIAGFDSRIAFDRSKASALVNPFLQPGNATPPFDLFGN